MNESVVVLLKLLGILGTSTITYRGLKILLCARNDKRGHLELKISGSVNIICFMTFILAALIMILIVLTFFL